MSIIVAINKMDKPGANPDHVLQQLTEYELVPEEWGGDTPCIRVSALTGEGIDDLLEMVVLVADLKELKANPDSPGQGHRGGGKARQGPRPGGHRTRAEWHAAAPATSWWPARPWAVCAP